MPSLQVLALGLVVLRRFKHRGLLVDSMPAPKLICNNNVMAGLLHAHMKVEQVSRTRPPEAPPYVCPENSGFLPFKMAISLSGDSGFWVAKARALSGILRI